MAVRFTTAGDTAFNVEFGEGIASSGVKRGEVFLTTKVWVSNYRRADFLRSVDESLGKLRTDYVDLLLLHWPNAAVPLAEQIGALNEVKKAGKVGHIGVSNFNRALLAESVRLSDAPIVTNQIEYHPYLDQSVMLEAARQTGQSVTAYYAMADGAVFADRAYDDSGNLVSRAQPGAMIHDPEVAATNVLRMLEEGVIVSVTGKRIPCTAHSVCVHGDEPSAVAMATNLRRTLEAKGVRIATLPEMRERF